MLKRLILIQAFSLIFLSCPAQTDTTSETKAEITNDSIITEEDTHLIMFSLGYSSNNTKNKNFLDIKMPTLSGDVYFFAKNGIWASASYSNYIDAGKNTYETEIALGYQKYFFNVLDIDFSYGYHYFNGDTLYSGIDYDHAFYISAGIDLDFVNFYMDNSYYIGETKNYFLDFSLGLNLEGDDVLFKEDNVSLSPTILTSFGTNDFIYLDIIPRQIRHRGQVINLPPQIIESTESEFLYQNFALLAPIIYTIDNFSFTFAWSYTIPSKKLKEVEWKEQSGIFISISYIPNIF